MGVTAGHNGGLNLSETNTLKFHLLKAGFIDPEAFIDSKKAEASVEYLSRCPRALGNKARDIRHARTNTSKNKVVLYLLGATSGKTSLLNRLMDKGFPET